MPTPGGVFLMLNRRSFTHRVSGGKAEIVRQIRENAQISQLSKTSTAVSWVICR